MKVAMNAKAAMDKVTTVNWNKLWDNGYWNHYYVLTMLFFGTWFKSDPFYFVFYKIMV